MPGTSGSPRYDGCVLARLAIPATISTLLTATLACAAIGSDADADETATGDTGEFSCDAIVGEGYDIGQVSMNWTLHDAEGQLHSLYEFCGRPIYIEDTAAW